MGAPYTSKSIGATYNQNPPPDDGTQSEANRVKFSTVKTKLSDPIKAFGDAINAELLLAFAKIVGGGGVTSVSSTYTVQTSDQGNQIVVTASATITTPAAATVGSPFAFFVQNNHTAAITVDGNASETVNGLASISIGAGQGAFVFTDGTNWFAVGGSSNRLPRGHIDGLTLSNNSSDSDHDIDIAVGECRADDNEADIILSTAITKQIDASWAVGTDAGGLDGSESVDGTPDASTWYYVWLIRRSDTGVVDALFSESATAPTMPTDYDQKRRIGAVLTDSSANIVAFSQFGDEFLWESPVNNTTASPSGTTRLVAVTTPSTIQTIAILNVLLGDTGACHVRVYSPDQGEGPAVTSSNAVIKVNANLAGTRVHVRTNATAQVNDKSDAAADTYAIATEGWIDLRGKDG